MKRIFLTLAIISVAWMPVAHAKPHAEKPSPVVVATAPSGAFHTEVARLNGGPLSVVPTKMPSQRQVLKPAPFKIFKPDETAPTPTPAPAGEPQPMLKGTYETITTDKLDFLPLTFISPDSRWIYVAQDTDEEKDDENTIGYLYRRVPDSPDDAPKFEPATTERLDILAFRFVVAEEHINAQHPGEMEEEGICTLSVHFVAWSPDSARLLLALEYQTGTFPDTKVVTNWLGYFNTRTGAFERTDRLRTADKILLATSSEPDHVIPGSAAEVLHAESLGQEGPFVPAKDRFARADAELNAVYQQLLKRLDPPAQKVLRQEERDWLTQKEFFAAVHADGSWSPFTEASRTDWQAVATEARAAELSRRLHP